MKIEIKYPSGMSFKVVATWHGYRPRQQCTIVKILKPIRDPWGTFYNRGKVMACDSRAVLVKDDGVVLYHPRMKDLDLSTDVREWLDANPEWGGPDDGVAFVYQAKVKEGQKS